VNQIQPFTNGEFNLEFIPDGDSFNVVAAGLAHSLGVRSAADLLRSIPDSEKGYSLARTLGGDQRVRVVAEAGFYRALGQRRTSHIRDAHVRAAVERFQSWVYGEVLPSLRRASTQTPTTPLTIDATVTALAALAHREHVVPAAGRILAHERWHNTPKGVRAFVQLIIDLDPPGIEHGGAHGGELSA
jgi:prophage antirepressor-like protein